MGNSISLTLIFFSVWPTVDRAADSVRGLLPTATMSSDQSGALVRGHRGAGRAGSGLGKFEKISVQREGFQNEWVNDRVHSGSFICLAIYRAPLVIWVLHFLFGCFLLHLPVI